MRWELLAKEIRKRSSLKERFRDERERFKEKEKRERERDSWTKVSINEER